MTEKLLSQYATSILRTNGKRFGRRITGTMIQIDRYPLGYGIVTIQVGRALGTSQYGWPFHQLFGLIPKHVF